MTQKQLKEKLFKENVNSVYRYVYLRTNNKALAEDITAQTFEKMLHKDDLKEGLAKYWLITVARNTMYKHFRDDKRAENAQQVELDELPSDIPTEPAEMEVSTQLQDLVAKKLHQIPKLNQEVIALKIWEELTFKEIADILDEKESTVKLRYYRGLKKLRAQVVSVPAYKELSKGAALAALTAVATSTIYLPTQTFITNFISTNFINMASTSTLAAITSWASQNTAQLALGGLVTTGVVVGGATIAVTQIQNERNNTESPTSYSQIINQPSAETRSTTTTSGNISEQNLTRFESRQGIPTNSFTPFSMDLPQGWQVEEDYQPPEGQDMLYEIRVQKDTYSMEISQYRRTVDYPSCIFELGHPRDFPANIFYMDSPEFIEVAGTDYQLALDKLQDLRSVNNYTEEMRLTESAREGSGFEICAVTDGENFGDLETRFGWFDVNVSGSDYNPQLTSELKQILSSIQSLEDNNQSDADSFSEYTSDPALAFSYEQFSTQVPSGWDVSTSVEQMDSPGGTYQIASTTFQNQGYLLEFTTKERTITESTCYFNSKEEAYSQEIYGIYVDTAGLIELGDNNYEIAWAPTSQVLTKQDFTGNIDQDMQPIRTDANYFFCEQSNQDSGSAKTAFGEIKLTGDGNSELFDEALSILENLEPVDGTINSIN